MSEEAGGHPLLVLLVGTALAHEDLFERQAEGFHLSIEQFQPHTVHGHTLKMLVAGREQRDHLITGVIPQPIQRERRIFSAAPAKDNFFFHNETMTGERSTIVAIAVRLG